MSQQVRVVAYDARWADEFRKESEKIKEILGGECVAVHHIGSTAVEGLQAKPIVDIMPVVKDIGKIDALYPEFEALGYECMGEFGIAGRRYFRKGGDERTHQVHIFEESNRADIGRHLAVRNYLRTHEEERRAYGELKETLARKFPRDIEKYCDGKERFVRALEQRALSWSKSELGFSLAKPSVSFAKELCKHADNPAIAANLRDLFPNPYTLRDAEGFMKFCEAEEGKSQFVRIIVVDEKPVGCISATFGRDVSRRDAEIGYWLGESYRGHNIMPRALNMLAEEVFSLTNIVRLHAVPFAYNKASCRVLEKSGFTLEGRLKKSVFKNGNLYDSLLYARIKEDFCE